MKSRHFVRPDSLLHLVTRIYPSFLGYILVFRLFFSGLFLLPLGSAQVDFELSRAVLDRPENPG